MVTHLSLVPSKNYLDILCLVLVAGGKERISFIHFEVVKCEIIKDLFWASLEFE
jgi:hypothetical protein